MNPFQLFTVVFFSLPGNDDSIEVFIAHSDKPIEQITKIISQIVVYAIYECPLSKITVLTKWNGHVRKNQKSQVRSNLFFLFKHRQIAFFG